jgi:hypothetical protein
VVADEEEAEAVADGLGCRDQPAGPVAEACLDLKGGLAAACRDQRADPAVATDRALVVATGLAAASAAIDRALAAATDPAAVAGTDQAAAWAAPGRPGVRVTAQA